jgi:membrane associated rhomboid family serine protease
MNRPASVQFATPRMTPVVKIVLIASAVLFVLDLVGQRTGFSLSAWFGFVPARLLEAWVWQPFTYPFLHAGLFHLLFNLLVIWTIGAELEALWGTRTFVGFFFVCAVGAAMTHGVFSLLGIGPGALSPVVGSSGVVYGLLLAYGLLFGERTMYFFMLFPMPAKYFVALLGAIELVSSVFYGQSGVAHLAHLGGMLFGFLFLASMAAWRRRARTDHQEAQVQRDRQKRLKKAGHLRLVQGEEEDENSPKHWN